MTRHVDSCSSRGAFDLGLLLGAGGGVLIGVVVGVTLAVANWLRWQGQRRREWR